MKKKTKVVKLLMAIIVLLISLFFLYQSFFWPFFVKDGQLVNLVLKNNPLSSQGKNLLVEIVKNNQSIQEGLSDRDQLESSNGQEIDGMLFIFPSAKIRYFWMKGMKFDIDICWFNKNFLLDCSRKALKPNIEQDEAQLPIYQSPQAADMVFETKPGLLEEELFGSKLYINLL